MGWNSWTIQTNNKARLILSHISGYLQNQINQNTEDKKYSPHNKYVGSKFDLQWGTFKGFGSGIQNGFEVIALGMGNFRFDVLKLCPHSGKALLTVTL